MSDAHRRALKDALVLALLALALTLPAASRPTFVHEDEYRNAVMVREMDARGLAFLPTLHEEPYADYPPLYFWLATLSARALGLSPLAPRLPAALGVVLTALGTWLLVRRTGGGERLARVAGALAIVAPGAFLEERRAMIDPLLAGLTTTAIALFVSGERGEPFTPARLALGAIALVLAWFTKGPLAVVLVALPVFADGALVLASSSRKEHGALLRAASGPFAIGVAGVLSAATWYAIAFAVGGREFGWNSLVYQTWHRAFGSITQHKEPIGYYLPNLALLLPLSAIAPFGLMARRARRTAFVAAFWFALVFIFLSVMNTKRSYYLLPAYPAVAILAAIALVRRRVSPSGNDGGYAPPSDGFAARGSSAVDAIARGLGYALAALVLVVAIFARVIDLETIGEPATIVAACAIPGALFLAAFARRARLAEGVVALLALALTGVWLGVIPAVAPLRAHFGFTRLLERSGFHAGDVALYDAHREALCWFWAPDATHAMPLLAKPDDVDRFLAGAKPGARCVIIREKDLVGPLDTARRSDLSRAVVPDVEDHDYCGVVRK